MKKKTTKAPPRKPSKAATVARELAAGDKTAQAVDRDDIEYGLDTALPTGQHVSTMTAPQTVPARPTRSVEDWRKNRKPLTRPHGSTEPKKRRT